MRTHLALLAAFSLAVATATLTETRAASAYTSLTLSNPAACARACADDGICMAWSYRAENTCELSAIVAAPPSNVIASGFADRAPTLALRQLTGPAAPMAAPVIAELPLASEPDQEEMPQPLDADEASAMLLGGPDEGDLRLGLGSRR